MIETALPSGIGQAPIFRSFGPQKMAGGEGDELRPAADADLCGQVGDVAFHGLGRQVEAGRDAPGGESFGQQRQHFGLPRGYPRRGQGVGQVRCRPVAAGYRGAGLPEKGAAGGGHRGRPGRVEESGG